MPAITKKLARVLRDKERMQEHRRARRKASRERRNQERREGGQQHQLDKPTPSAAIPATSFDLPYRSLLTPNRIDSGTYTAVELDGSAIVVRVVLDKSMPSSNSATNIGLKPMELSDDQLLDTSELTLPVYPEIEVDPVSFLSSSPATSSKTEQVRREGTRERSINDRSQATWPIRLTRALTSWRSPQGKSNLNDGSLITQRTDLMIQVSVMV